MRVGGGVLVPAPLNPCTYGEKGLNELLNSQDVARLLKCSVPLIYKMAEQGRLSCVRIPCPGLGTRKKELVRFKHEDVIQFIEMHYKT